MQSGEFIEVTRLWKLLRQAPQDKESWQSLFRSYSTVGMEWQATYVRRQLSRLGVKPIWEPSAVRSANLPAKDLNSLLSRDDVVQAQKLLSRLEAWLRLHPGDWLGWLLLSRTYDVLPSLQPMFQAAYTRAQELEIVAGDSVHWLGVWRLTGGDALGSAQMLQQLVSRRPMRHGSMIWLGQALFRLGNVQAAELAFSRASLSDNPALLALLAEVSFNHNYWQEAIEILKKAVQLRPDDVSLWLALAHIQSKCYELSGCRDSLTEVLRLEPQNSDALSLKIGLQGQLGDTAAYFQALQEQYAATGSGNSRLLSSVLMTSLYQDELSPQTVSHLHRSYVAKLGNHKNQVPVRLKPQRIHIGRLRVAYVTGDLHRQHPVNIFLLPLLLQQKLSQRLEIFIYHTGTMHDNYTARARECADVWIEAANWDDDALHRRIVDDDTDVLIDLAGHTATHRLGVFLNRSAPVQATFLGYPHSTGLDNMDFLIGDAVVSPVANEKMFTEKVARLSGSVFCWAPVDDYPLPTGRRASGSVVFGSFNNALKLSPKTIALWSRVLRAVEYSTLLLKAPSFMNAEVIARFRSLFEMQGIPSDRIEFRGPSELGAMMQEYADIDIALDPLPYNGGTTSLQALWMGVPVISLEGKSFQNRMGASFLKALNHKDWLAQNEDSYVDIAQKLSRNIEIVRSGRASLRTRLRQSPLGDIEQYAQNFESLLFEMCVRTQANST